MSRTSKILGWLTDTAHDLGYDPEDLIGDLGETARGYKLFRQKDDQLYPLFVNANQPVEQGVWLPAEAGELTSSGQVKSSLGPLAYRPGWHAGEYPIATHIGGKSRSGLSAPDYRPDEQVWAEIEMPAAFDWQAVADANADVTNAGEALARTAHITDRVPYGGHYRYKTNPNMAGDWMIGGNMRVNRVLDDAEVKAINDAAGVADLPRKRDLFGAATVGAGLLMTPEDSMAMQNLDAALADTEKADDGYTSIQEALDATEGPATISAPESPFWFHQGQRWGDVERGLRTDTGVDRGLGMNWVLPLSDLADVSHKLGRGEDIDLMDIAMISGAAVPFGIGGPAFRGITRRGLSALQGYLWANDDE